MSAVPNIIAICGYKRSGKDTVANFIVENYGYEHYKLATPLKECIQQLFGFTREEMEGHLKEEVNDIWVGEHGDSSVNLFVRPWVKSDDYWAVYFGLMERVKMAFDKEGISIPYPQRDVHIHQK